VGLLLAVALVVSGVFLIGAFERTHFGESTGTRAAHLFTNGAPLAAFGVFAGAGIWQRRVAARHKRLLLLATIVLLPAAIGRLFANLGVSSLNFPVYAGFAFANVGYDVWSRRRPHAVSLLGAMALVTIDVTTTWWLALVES